MKAAAVLCPEHNPNAVGKIGGSCVTVGNKPLEP